MVAIVSIEICFEVSQVFGFFDLNLLVELIKMGLNVAESREDFKISLQR